MALVKIYKQESDGGGGGTAVNFHRILRLNFLCYGSLTRTAHPR